MTYQVASLQNIEGINNELLNIMKMLPKTDIHEGPWIAGGSVRRLIKNDGINGDIDIFFKNKHQQDIFEKELITWIEKNELSSEWGCVKTHITTNAKTFDINVHNLKRYMNLSYDHKKLTKKPSYVDIIKSAINEFAIKENEKPSKYDENIKIQLITKFYVNDVEDLANHFDFTVCQLFTDTNNLVFTNNAFDDLTLGYLNINNNKFDIENSLLRISKYCSMNFIPVPGTYLKIISHPNQTFSTQQSES